MILMSAIKNRGKGKSKERNMRGETDEFEIKTKVL